MNASLATVRQLTQPAVQDVVIDAVVSGHGRDRHTGDSAGGHQLGLELGAVGAAAAASLGELVVDVHVSTIYDVDTMLLDLGYRCQMGWPDAYGCSACRTLSNQPCKRRKCQPCYLGGVTVGKQRIEFKNSDGSIVIKIYAHKAK